MECFVALTAVGFLGITVLSALAGVAYTVFWVWMVLDSIVRDSSQYPKGVDKLIWVLLNAFVQPAFVLYYVLVYRAAVSGSAAMANGAGRAAV